MMVLVPALGVPGETLLQDTLKSTLVALFALAAALAWLLLPGRPPARIRLHALLCLPLGLMLYALGSMAWSHTFLAGVEAVRWFVFSLIVLLGLNTLTLERVSSLAWAIHLGAVTASLWAALQFWFDFSVFAQGPNPASTFVNRNFFAEFLVCTLPFSVLLLTRVRDKATVFMLTFSVGFNIAALLMTGTRSALLGLALLALLLPALALACRQQWRSAGWRPAQVLALAALLLATVGAIGSIPTTNPRLIEETGAGNAIDRATGRALSLAQPAEYASGSFAVRARLWATTARMIGAHPLRGVGAGAWEVQAPRFQEAGSELETDFYAHNELLQLLAEYGLAGWLFLAALAAYLLRAAWCTATDRSSAGRREAPLRAFTLASVLVLLLVSNAGFPWRLAGTGALFALSLALLAASDARLPARPWRLLRSLHLGPARARCSAGVLALAMALALYIAQQAMACEASLVQAVKMALTIARSGQPQDPRWDGAKAELMALLRQGIAINPHYRKLTPIAADAMAGWGDWDNATWVWESVLASRPHVVALLANVARGHLQAGHHDRAQAYLDRARSLQPSAAVLDVLQAMLWSQTGQDQQAAALIRQLLRSGLMDSDLVQTGYALGLRSGDRALAMETLELATRLWPASAADSWLRLASLHDASGTGQDSAALHAYRAAVQASAPAQRPAVLARIPPAYQAVLR